MKIEDDNYVKKGEKSGELSAFQKEEFSSQIRDHWLRRLVDLNEEDIDKYSSWKTWQKATGMMEEDYYWCDSFQFHIFLFSFSNFRGYFKNL